MEHPPTMGLDPVDYAIIAVYLVGVAWIGTRIGGRQQSSRDYFLGGRACPGGRWGSRWWPARPAP